MSPEQKDKAQEWDNPQTLIQVEEGRYLFQRAISRVISNTFKRYTAPGAVIFEVGAGLGFLKDLVPIEYHTRYITSDYSVKNLVAGTNRRQIRAVAASAFELPLADSSIDCLVNMDAYDTLPNLSEALAEVKRVLTPEGVYMHFQVNHPSDDTAWNDHPDYIFFPRPLEESFRAGPMIGIKRH